MPARALVVMSYFPLPMISGGRKRAARLLEAMQRAGATPRILTFDATPEGLAEGRDRGWEVEVFDRPPGTPASRIRQHIRREPMPASLPLLRRLRELTPQSTFIEVEEYEALQYLRGVRELPTVASMYNVDSQVYANIYAMRERSRVELLRDRYHLSRQRTLERRYARRASALLCVSEADCAYFLSRGAANPVLVPNGVDDDLFQIPANAASRSDVLFFASFSWQPNVDGIVRFLIEAWPRVRERFPEIRLRVAGPGSSIALAAHAHSVPGVEVLGFVDDLQGELQRARIVLAPLWVGGGTRIKVLEALAAARPVVGTPLGVEQIGFIDGRHGLLGESPAELAEGVVRLRSDDVLTQRAGDAGRALMESQRWSRVTESAEALYGKWISEARR
jgi:polysaccharide biosynthesis protein PslH